MSFNIFNIFWLSIATKSVFNTALLLSYNGLYESYRVVHLSTHFPRIFLSITAQSQTSPTLIETQWPKTYLPNIMPIIYPHPLLHANGDHTNCRLIQQAHWSQVDSVFRLWVMDIGWFANNTCNPKLLVFDLLRNNMEVLHIDCGKYIRPNASELLDIELGPRITPYGHEKFIYFLLANDHHLLAYDILEQKWHYRQMKSKKYSFVNELLPIKPQGLAFGIKGEILVSDDDGNLYSAPSETINDVRDSINMSLLGTLLGPTQNMIVDSYGVLYYVVTKFGAVVRCVYKQKVKVEDSEIIHMTSKNIQQIFFGSKGSVWLLTEKWLKPNDKCFIEY